MRRTGILTLLVSAMVLSALAAQSSDTPSVLAPPLGLDWFMPAPANNVVTARKAALGERLFKDTRLSSDGRIACASCHRPDRGFADDVEISAGAAGRKGRRHTPVLINRGYGRAFFWDGRSPTLEDQVLQPVTSATELDSTLVGMTAMLRRDPDYVREFFEVFSAPPSPQDAARALATYLRVQRSGNTPFDHYEQGDRSALTDAARRGLALFRGRAQCGVCHVGPNFSDEGFHNTGVAWRGGTLQDVGRFAVTRRTEDRGAFKTPTLRDIARTSPYMHDGSIPTLQEVVSFYNDGGRRNPTLDAEITPLGLSDADKQDLLAFLNSLTAVDRRP